MFPNHNISFFLDRSYSGLEFNLVAANSNGEALHLAKPRRKAPMGNDAVIVQAITLSKRGDFQRAFNIVNRNYKPRISPIDLELLRADLLHKVNRIDDAISEVKRLRTKTSLPANVFMLDKLEFDIYLAQKNIVEANRLLDRLADTAGENSSFYLQLKADVLAMEGKIDEALGTIENGLLTEEYDATLMAAYVRIAAENIGSVSKDIQTKATDRAWYALYLTHYASADILKDAASLFYHLGETHKALPIIEHALIMKPNDISLRQWHESVGTNCGN